MDKEALRQASAALAGRLSQPGEFVAGLHRLLETHADEKAFANYHCDNLACFGMEAVALQMTDDVQTNNSNS